MDRLTVAQREERVRYWMGLAARGERLPRPVLVARLDATYRPLGVEDYLLYEAARRMGLGALDAIVVRCDDPDLLEKMGRDMDEARLEAWRERN
jgi:hypothetical protein